MKRREARVRNCVLYMNIFTLDCNRFVFQVAYFRHSNGSVFELLALDLCNRRTTHIVFFAEYLPIVILVESVVTTGDIVFVWYDLVFCAANGMFGHKNSLFS